MACINDRLVLNLIGALIFVHIFRHFGVHVQSYTSRVLTICLDLATCSTWGVWVIIAPREGIKQTRIVPSERSTLELCQNWTDDRTEKRFSCGNLVIGTLELVGSDFLLGLEEQTSHIGWVLKALERVRAVCQRVKVYTLVRVNTIGVTAELESLWIGSPLNGKVASKSSDIVWVRQRPAIPVLRDSLLSGLYFSLVLSKFSWQMF